MPTVDCWRKAENGVRFALAIIAADAILIGVVAAADPEQRPGAEVQREQAAGESRQDEKGRWSPH
jgi:hypothetical protein